MWHEQGKVNPGESWLQHLKTQDYDELSFEQRVNILWTLVNLALDGPTVRAALEGRTEEAQRIRKQMWEEAKVSVGTPQAHHYYTRLSFICKAVLGVRMGGVGDVVHSADSMCGSLL